MNTPTRLEKIETMLAETPDDAFLRYALAMELNKAGEHERSLAELNTLTSADPPHIPACFMTGQQLAQLGRIDEAREILRFGIENARQQGDAHAAGEMSELLTELGAAGN